MKHLLELLSHRVAQLLIDKIDHIEDGSHIVCIKNLSFNDPFFSSEIPITELVMPQQTLIDAHIQSGMLYLLHTSHLDVQHFRLDKILSFSALTDVFPGDQLRIETEYTSQKDESIQFKSRSYVNGNQCSEISFSIHQSNPSTSSTFIHPTASIHPSVILGQGVQVGPYCIINEGVSIDDGTTIAAHVMVDKWCKIGKHNAIQYGAVIGSEAQDAKYKGEFAYVSIGDHNHIREYVTINRATGENEATKIGSNNMLLTNTHVGHNCTIGDKVTMANVVHLGGHTVVEDNATIGGLTGVHQFVRIGKGTMIGGYSRLIQDVPPFMLCDGNPAHVRNLNIIGCRRRGMDKQTLTDLKQLYKLLYRSNLNTKQALSEFSPEQSSDEIDHLISFINQDTSRGISKKTVADHASDE